MAVIKRCKSIDKESTSVPSNMTAKKQKYRKNDDKECREIVVRQ